MRGAQRGITLMGFLIVLVIAGFFAYMAMRLVPPFLEFGNVKSAMNAVAAEPGIAGQPPRVIRDRLSRRFDTSYVDSLKPENVRVQRVGNRSVMSAKYEVRRPFINNIEFAITFEHSVDMAGGGRAN